MRTLPKDIPDDIDRRQATASVKLAQLASWVREQVGEDPRGGGWSFIAKPHVILACFNELPPLMRLLAPKISVSDSRGRGDADVVFRWEGIPVRLRHNAKGDVMHAGKTRDLPPSKNEDRRAAGEMRMNLWRSATS